MNKLTFIVVSFCLLIAAGCSTAGTHFDTAKVPKIERGVTTKADVLKMFGQPLNDEITSKGEFWTYTYIDSHTTGAGVVGTVFVGVHQSETICNSLIISFDGDIVRDYNCNQSSHTDTYVK